MGTYVVTGGTKGIGEQTVRILRENGHDVISMGMTQGDIAADLGTNEGRELALKTIRERCADGLDGLVCNHGIAQIPMFSNSYILSVNYFGAIAIIEGLYNLLKKRSGNCVVTVSGSIAYVERGKHFIDGLLNNCGDEERIGRLVDTFDNSAGGNIIYASTKIALSRWVRRVSSSWASHGVNINAVAPGGVMTTIMHGHEPGEDNFVYPMPALFSKGRGMLPEEVAHAIAFLVMPNASGVSGAVLYCDAGAGALRNTETYF